MREAPRGGSVRARFRAGRAHMKHGLRLRRIAVKSLRAHPLRALILLLLAAAQAACIFAGTAFSRAARQEAELAQARLGADILVYPSAAMSRISAGSLVMQGTPVDVRKPRSSLKGLSECEGVSAVSYQIYIRDAASEQATWIAGFEPQTDFAVSPWLSGGSADVLRPGSVIAGCDVCEGKSEVSLFGKSWPIDARLTRTDSALDSMVFTDTQTFNSLISAAAEAGISAYAGVDAEKDYSVALLRVDDKSALDSVTNWINTHIRKVKAVRSDESLSGAAQSMQESLRLTQAATAAIWAMLLTALVIAENAMTKERRREMQVWRLIGASRALVRREMLLEALFVYGAGAIVGTALGAYVLCALPSTDLSLSALASGALASVCVSVTAGCAAAFFAVRRAARTENALLLNI